MRRLSFEKRLNIFFLSVIVGIFIIGVVAYQTNQNYQDTNAQVKHTQEVLYETEQVFSITKDFESGSRGYVITGDSNYLEHFNVAKDVIFFHIQKLKELTRDNRLQQIRIDSLMELTYRRLGFSRESIKLRNEPGFTPSNQLASIRRGMAYMNEMRRIISMIQKEENDLLIVKQQENLRSTAAFNRAFYFLLGALVVLTVIILAVIRINFARSRAAEEQAKAGEKQIQTIFAAAPDAVVVIDDEGNITRWNAKAETLFGWTDIEVLGRPLSETIIPHRYREEHKKGMKRFFETGEGPVLGKSIEIYALKKSGEEFDVSLSISPTLVSGKHLFIGFIRDITERKKAVEEIRRTNNFLDTILENIPNMIFVKEAHELRFVRFNKAGEDLLGYRREDLLGKNDYDFFPKEQADFFTDKDREVLNKKELLDIPEEPINTANGQLWLHTKKIPIIDDKGNTSYLLGISEDITERKKHEELLLESNERFHKLFYSNPTAMSITTVVTKNGGGEFVDVNESFEKLIGCKKSELIGKHAVDMGIISREALMATAELTQDSKFTRSLELQVKNRLGQQRSVLVSIERMKVMNADCTLSAIVDITERKAAEGKIKDLNEHLAQTVLQLEEVNKELESFTYSVSHDLRSPLRIIDGYADILLNDHKDDMGEDCKNTLNVIIINARRMGRLIDDLLNLSRISRRELSIHPVVMNEMVKPVIEEQLKLVPEQKTDIKLSLLEPVNCDSGIIRQVWENLISNALKYSSKKEKSVIEIGSYKEGNNITYFVKDNGVGFDMKYADKLFGIFQRLHKMDEYKGTGVGLALVQRIVSRHGGRVWADAEENKGATFYFSLPANNS